MRWGGRAGGSRARGAKEQSAGGRGETEKGNEWRAQGWAEGIEAAEERTSYAKFAGPLAQSVMAGHGRPWQAMVHLTDRAQD